MKRELKNGASGRDPALRGACKCSTCNRLEAGGSKLEAWLTAPDFFEPRASCLKLTPALADGLMFVFRLLFQKGHLCDRKGGEK